MKPIICNSDITNHKTGWLSKNIVLSFERGSDYSNYLRWKGRFVGGTKTHSSFCSIVLELHTCWHTSTMHIKMPLYNVPISQPLAKGHNNYAKIWQCTQSDFGWYIGEVNFPKYIIKSTNRGLFRRIMIMGDSKRF